MRSQTLVIIPAFNEEETIGRVVSDVRRSGFPHVVVIDDGSADQTATLAKRSGALVLRREKNRGMGAATQRGIEYGLAHEFKYFLTIDADGQQKASDLLVVLTALQNHVCVLGSRFLQKNSIPLSRRLANKIANIITGFFFGVWVSDSQTGVRGFTRKVARELHLFADGFEFASLFLSEIQEMGLRIHEVPIYVEYSEYSLSKGQGWREGFRTFRNLIRGRGGK